MRLALLVMAAGIALSACAGAYVSADGGKRATPGAEYSEGIRQ